MSAKEHYIESPIFFKKPGRLARFLDDAEGQENEWHWKLTPLTIVSEDILYDDVKPIPLGSSGWALRKGDHMLLLHLSYLPQNITDVRDLRQGVRSIFASIVQKEIKPNKDIRYIVAASHERLISVLMKEISSFTIVDHLKPHGEMAEGIIRMANAHNKALGKQVTGLRYPVAAISRQMFIRSVTG